MSNQKTVQQVLPPPTPHMVGDGFRVHNFFPGGYNMPEDRMSPFYMMDYNAKFEFPPSEKPKGVDVHPHRGFETVTIAYKGSVEHYDSAGNHGIIGEGDLQWMTAGSGVLHKEFHEKEFSKTGGTFQMVQLWVNLPAKHKMTPPKYQGIENKQLGRYPLSNNLGEIEIIAGSYQGTKGPANTFSPVEMYNGKVKKGAKVSFELPARFNTGILVVEGSLKINDSDVAPVNNFVLFTHSGEHFSIEALEDSIFLVLSGEPLNEPIVAHGPFLMNTVDEIRQARRDFGSGKFGHLE